VTGGRKVNSIAEANVQSSMLNMKVLNRNGLLYPMLVIAAISVTVFSALGVATMTGLLPHAASMSDVHATNDAHVAAQSGKYVAGNGDPACANCGVVISIVPVEVKGGGSGLGMVAGGVTGALVGTQIGRGNGNAVATIAGAAGGAFAGNEIEKNMNKVVRYQVWVRMHDGTSRTSYQSSAPAFAVGDKVKVVNGQVVVIG
jgi:outer membrane lipoprotein SlyB